MPTITETITHDGMLSSQQMWILDKIKEVNDPEELLAAFVSVKITKPMLRSFLNGCDDDYFSDRTGKGKPEVQDVLGISKE